MKKIYLKGLNSYRAIAALIVIVGHTEMFKQEYGFENFLNLDFFKFTGQHTAVILFFALSGFLITILLLKEREDCNRINLKKFYLRRIFRVWPLFYLVLILSLILLNYSPSISTTVLCFTIFPNVAHALKIGWTASPQVWSIGVEEQFYLGWPWLFKIKKHLLTVFVFLFFFFALLPHFLSPLLSHFVASAKLNSFLGEFFYGTKFHCMAAGGIFALLYHQKHWLINWLNRNIIVSYFFLLLPFALWFSAVHIPFFTDEMYAALFAISILIISTHPNIIDIDYAIPNYLGKISFGLYMYHWIILELIFRNNLLQIHNKAYFNVALYGLVLSITIVISALSYHFIEKKFLSAKEKFSS